MKNSNKKIEKLKHDIIAVSREHEYVVAREFVEFENKLNEIIDKVNELEEYRNSKKHYEYENGQWVERTKLKSQPEESSLAESLDKLTDPFYGDKAPMEECKHERAVTAGGSVAWCAYCKKVMKPWPKSGKPEVFYTSEGDAVGEVEKKCEHDWHYSWKVINGQEYPLVCSRCGIGKVNKTITKYSDGRVYDEE